MDAGMAVAAGTAEFAAKVGLGVPVATATLRSGRAMAKAGASPMHLAAPVCAGAAGVEMPTTTERAVVKGVLVVVVKRMVVVVLEMVGVGKGLQAHT